MNVAVPRWRRLLAGSRTVGVPMAWSLGGNGLSKVAVLVTTLVVTRLLDPAGFGQYVSLVAVGILAASLWDLGVSTVLTRELAAGRLTTRSALMQALTLRLRTLPLWFLAFGAGAALVSHGSGTSLPAVAAFALASLVWATHGVTRALLQGQLRFRALGVSVASGQWMIVLLSLATLTVSDPGRRLEMLGLAAAAGELWTLGLTALLCRRGGAGDRSAHEPRQVRIREALPFAANGILSTAYNRLDVVIVAALAGGYQLGLYAPASRIQDALYLVPGSLGAVGLPLLARAWAGPGAEVEVRLLVSHLVAVGLLLAIPLALVASLFMPELIGFALGPAYEGAALPSRILVWSLVFGAAGAPLLAALAATGHAADTTKVFLTASIVALVLHLSLDWWAGATGAAVASLARDPAAVMVAFLLARRAGLVSGISTSTRTSVTSVLSEVDR